jgi:hypothetical protein
VTDRRLAPKLVAVVLTGFLVASCAETVVNETSDAGEINVGGSFETIPTTTLPISGTTAELLAEMSTEMGRLSSEISAPGDEQATLDRIQRVWVIARPDVESTRPELVGGIDTTVDMARTAVTRIRPADGDKALQILTDLVERYNAGS